MFGALGAGGVAGTWKCELCSCQWPDKDIQCGACEAPKPGVTQEEIQERKNALVRAFTGAGAGPKPTGFGGGIFGGGSGVAAPIAFGSLTNAANAAPGFGFGAGDSNTSVATPVFKFGVGDSKDALAPSNFGTSAGAGASFTFGASPGTGSATFGFGAPPSTGAVTLGFGAPPSTGSVTFGFGAGGGFAFKPSATPTDENIALAQKAKKRSGKADFEPRGEEPPCEVFVMGSGECEQLGLGDGVLEKKKPVLVSKGGLDRVAVLRVAVGGLHSIVCSVDGLVYSWGCNDDGALGRTGEENVPGLVKELADRKATVLAITAGDCHSGALTDAGRVWSWGSYKDSNGHVGFPDFSAVGADRSFQMITPGGEKALRQPVPQEVPKLGVVTQLASGDHHTFALTDQGELYSWGVDQVAQLGHGERTPDQPTDPDPEVQERKYQEWKKAKVKRLFPRRLDPAALPWRTADLQTTVRLVGCGSDFSFASTSGPGSAANETWACGLNGDFQLGLGKNSEAELAWTRISALSGVCLSRISGGCQHAAALDTTGSVWCWGRGERTGHKEKDGHVKTPRKVPAEAFVGLRVLQLGTGGSHTLACTENGDVFTWGTGGMYQLGNVPRDVNNFKREEREVEVGPDELSPCIVTSKLLGDRFIVSADGGSQHSVLLVWNGSPGARGKRKREPSAPRAPKCPRFTVDPVVLAMCLQELEDSVHVMIDKSMLMEL